MNKYLLPYKDISERYGYPAFRRPLFLYSDIDIGYTIYKGVPDNIWHVVGPKDGRTICSSKEEAMIALDKACIETGYTFISEERAQKLLLLL